jgi:hypothetical protein
MTAGKGSGGTTQTNWFCPIKIDPARQECPAFTAGVTPRWAEQMSCNAQNKHM